MAPADPRKRFACTMWDDDDDAWNTAVHVIDARTIRTTLGIVRALYLASFRYDALILNGAVPARRFYVDLLAGVLVRWFGGRCTLIITDATWEPGSRSLAARAPWSARWLPALSRCAVALLDSPRTHYCVLSSEERETFPAVWRVEASRVHVTPFHHTLYRPQDRRVAQQRGDYLFSGGDSLRDYALLAAAAADLPHEVRVAARWRPAPGATGLQVSTVSHDEFLDLMRNATACVVPLERAVRSAGQQTYLNAMLLEVPVIVTSAAGVADHVEDGVSGVVVEPDAASLRRALADVMQPERVAHYAQVAHAAKARVEASWTPEAYRRRLVDLAARLTSA